MTRHLGTFQALASILLTLGLVAGFQPTAANAIGFLVSSTPAPDQQLSSAPTQVSLLFSVGSIPAALKGNVITVTNSSGTPVEAGAAHVAGMTMAVDLKNDLNPDKYQVAYRYVCDDGHVLVGAFNFVLVAPHKVESPAPIASSSPARPKTKTAAPSAPVATASAQASVAPTASESAVPYETFVASATPDASPTAAKSVDGSTGWFWILGLLVIACAAGITLLVRKIVASRN